MRAIGLVLAALAFSLTWASAADAARRNDNGRPVASRSVASQGAAGRGQASRAATGRQGSALRAASPSRRVTAGRGPAPRGGMVSRASGRQMAAAASCTRNGRGARRCGPARVSWQAGLAPAAHVQTADCPDGTMATNAHGHVNITRCMPL